jgi:ketosteroid isomerase-like protein
MIEAAQRADWDLAMSGYDPEVVLDQSRMPDGGIYHGHAGVREFYARWFGAWDDLRMAPKRFIDAGEDVVVIMEIRGRGRGSGAEVAMRSADVRTIRNGKIVRHVAYPTGSEALEALGIDDEAM